MTTLMIGRTVHGPAATSRPTGIHLGRRAAHLLRGLRLRRTGAAAHTAPLVPMAPADCRARGYLRLTLQDGTPRLYLLDHRDFAATTSPEVAYDARVHTAYQLLLQGHRPEEIAERLALPAAAAQRIAEHAERSGPNGPGNRPPLS
ncbi:hypothetical protein [Kitasatospora sp. HPMI-4]|uniref:hypothetical protein n=1 Tax=Kitasatospora sp. HPMI-4 TaxID=3448443 RepID=UPI003F1BCC47